MEMPPSIPSLGLNVLAAISSPPGTEITTRRFSVRSDSSIASVTALMIIPFGPGLMAASPTLCFKPGFVTLPTPFPPSIRIPGMSETDTDARTRMPFVTSGSSPLSFLTAHTAVPPSSSASSTSSVSGIPFGVAIRTDSGAFPVRSRKAAALAAAAAQVPVVYPKRSFFPSFSA